jgi:hypothetical protein
VVELASKLLNILGFGHTPVLYLQACGRMGFASSVTPFVVEENDGNIIPNVLIRHPISLKRGPIYTHRDVTFNPPVSGIASSSFQLCFAL